MRRFLIIDGPNVTHAAQSAKKLTVGQTEVQAIYNFLRTLRALLGTYPAATPIVLWDGASWRNMIFPDYKIGREKAHTAAYQKQQAEKTAAKNQIPAIRKALELLGVAQVRASNMEADDLAAIIADKYVKRGDKIMLVSGDKDWIQLVGPGIAWFDPIRDRKVRKPEDVEAVAGFKVSTLQQFVEVKALMGDAGDSVPGIGGIGPKGAQEFIDKFGTWANFSNMALDGTITVALNAIDPKFRKAIYALAEDEDKRIAFAANMKLVDLRHPARPAPINFTVTPGEASQERFEAFCRRLVFASILKDIDNWLSVFPAFQPPWDAAA
jgi:5'-3' exonuclease